MCECGVNGEPLQHWIWKLCKQISITTNSITPFYTDVTSVLIQEYIIIYKILYGFIALISVSIYNLFIMMCLCVCVMYRACVWCIVCIMWFRSQTRRFEFGLESKCLIWPLHLSYLWSAGVVLREYSNIYKVSTISTPRCSSPLLSRKSIITYEKGTHASKVSL